MIRKHDAQKLCDEKLKLIKITVLKHDARTDGESASEVTLWDAGWRSNFVNRQADNWIARCYHDVKRIAFNTFYLMQSDEAKLQETILHEIAHAICGPGIGHTSKWVEKAKELGLSNPSPCGIMPISVDKARSITTDNLEKPKRKFNRVNAKCPICDSDAIEVSFVNLNNARWSRLKCGHLIKYEKIVAQVVDYKQFQNVQKTKQLFGYQGEGIEFLENSGGRGLIADEPGLGKTVQPMIFCYSHPETLPVLWVCKTTLKLQTVKEALEWLGPAYMAQIIEKPRSFIIPGMKFYIIKIGRAS